MSELAELLKRVEAATGPDREIDWRLAKLISHPSMEGASVSIWPPFRVGSVADKNIHEYTASIDAALALVERKLPGWYWRLDTPKSGPSFELAEFGEHPGSLKRAFFAEAKTLPLAILSALLRALLHEGQG